jgi:hypothetical protein
VTGVACNPGFGNADGNPANGCELNLQTDVHNCGSVGNGITNQFPNAIAACVNGEAVLAACKFGFGDANGNPTDGCEVNLPGFYSWNGSSDGCESSHTNHDQATATSLGSVDCSDANQTQINGTTIGSADEAWYKITLTAGLFCVNDFDGQIGGAGGARFRVLTNTSDTGLVTSFSAGAGFYSDGTTAWIEVRGGPSAGSFSLATHF